MPLTGINYLTEQDAIDLEEWLIGVIVSSMVYGGVLTLALSYIPLLLNTSHGISRRMRNFLLVYVTFMVAMSTIYVIAIIVNLTKSVKLGLQNFGQTNLGAHWSGSDDFNGYTGVVCTTLASWGADGFMLWRCAILYEGVSRPRRIALIAVLVFMAIMSLAPGLALCIVGFDFFPLLAIATIVINIVSAILITIRILYFDAYIRKTVGLERNNPYKTTIIICVESSALIIVFNLIYILCGFIPNSGSTIIPLQSLVHVYVISPLLIVYRVARGKARAPPESRPNISTIRFESHRPISSTNEV